MTACALADIIGGSWCLAWLDVLAGDYTLTGKLWTHMLNGAEGAKKMNCGVVRH